MLENIASVRVLEKAGLRLSGTIQFWEKELAKYVIKNSVTGDM